MLILNKQQVTHADSQGSLWFMVMIMSANQQASKTHDRDTSQQTYTVNETTKNIHHFQGHKK